MNIDIAVIGGGASGIAAAISAKEIAPSANVMVIEKLSRVGKKIIASGNGKCNLSNVNISEYNYHGSLNAVKVISAVPDYKEFFTEKLGILCTIGSEGKEGGVYPRSNSSSTVLNALRLRSSKLGVDELCSCDINEIIPKKNGFILRSADNEIFCRRVIIAAGGYAAPSFGTDGSIMRIMKGMGYKISKICPAVAPLKVDPNDIRGLKGVRVKGEISAYSGNKLLRTEKGELQFNENNISGICVFNLAYLFSEYEGSLKLRADLLPEISPQKLFGYLITLRRERGELSIEELLTGAFVKNLAVYLVKRSLDRSVSNPVSSLTKQEILAICGNIKGLEFKVCGCSSWQHAQATMGGIHSSCVDENLQSKLHKGLYFCGEILDVAGDCGGYNLQWAWSSGIMAGKNCGKGLLNDKIK